MKTTLCTSIGFSYFWNFFRCFQSTSKKRIRVMDFPPTNIQMLHTISSLQPWPGVRDVCLGENPMMMKIFSLSLLHAKVQKHTINMSTKSISMCLIIAPSPRLEAHTERIFRRMREDIRREETSTRLKRLFFSQWKIVYLYLNINVEIVCIIVVVVSALGSSSSKKKWKRVRNKSDEWRCELRAAVKTMQLQLMENHIDLREFATIKFPPKLTNLHCFSPTTR